MLTASSRAAHGLRLPPQRDLCVILPSLPPVMFVGDNPQPSAEGRALCTPSYSRPVHGPTGGGRGPEQAGTLAGLRRPAPVGLSTGSSRFARKKFPVAFLLRVKSSQFSCWSGVKVPENRGVSRGFWRVFSWPWPASWASELPGSRFLMFTATSPSLISPADGGEAGDPLLSPPPQTRPLRNVS